MQAPVSDSRFNMWRAILKVAHMTEHLTPDDRVALEATLSRKGMPAEQYKIIHDEILSPSELHSVLQHVTVDDDLVKFCEVLRLFDWNGGDLVAQAEAIRGELAAEIEKSGRGQAFAAAMAKSENSDVIAPLLEKPDGFDTAQSLQEYLHTVFPNLRTTMPSVTESELAMWRAVFSVAHADGVVMDSEKAFMNNILETVAFTEEQRDTLLVDMQTPQSIDVMFSRIEDQQDRNRFFYIARLLCWCDGDFDKQEQEIIARLNTMNFKSVDFEALIKDVDMSLVDDEDNAPQAAPSVQDDDETEAGGGFMSKVVGKLKKK